MRYELGRGMVCDITELQYFLQGCSTEKEEKFVIYLFLLKALGMYRVRTAEKDAHIMSVDVSHDNVTVWMGIRFGELNLGPLAEGILTQLADRERQRA